MSLMKIYHLLKHTLSFEFVSELVEITTKEMFFEQKKEMLFCVIIISEVIIHCLIIKLYKLLCVPLFYNWIKQLFIYILN